METSSKNIAGGRPAGLAVEPLDLCLVNVGSIPTGPTHGEWRLQPHPGDVLKSTPNVRKSPRSGLNLEGRLSDPQIYFRGSAPIDAERRRWPWQGRSEDWGGSSFCENSVINVFWNFRDNHGLKNKFIFSC